MRWGWWSALGVILVFVPAAWSEGKTSARLGQALREAGAEDRLLVWVYMRDKGGAQKAALPVDLVTSRSLRRRSKVLPMDHLVDAADLGVEPTYLEAIRALGLRIRHTSRWSNAASLDATPSQVRALAHLDFVAAVDLVLRGVRSEPEPALHPRHVAADPFAPARPTGLDYGASLGQMQVVRVPELHDRGITGEGILVGHFDDGYRGFTHESFTSLRIVAMRDFVNLDGDPTTPWPDPDIGAHGVETLSLLAGFAPGRFIGAAFGASYVLARTENDYSETPVEEDNWVAAVEWAESLGVDVVSTSLGYLEYSPPHVSWTWEDMDGNTTPITRAADRAVERGVVVVVAAGNGGRPTGGRRNTLGAPADGDSVVAVGALDHHGLRADFSSMGPTAGRRRIKPDVMAPGIPVMTASAGSPTGYEQGVGTSFSCPLVAGIAALLLSARPSSTPMQIVDAMRGSASNASAPNNGVGWGTVDGVAALEWLRELDPFVAYVQRPAVPNPFRDTTRIELEVPGSTRVDLRVYDARGRLVRTLVAGERSRRMRIATWDGRDEAGHKVAAGVYLCEIRAESNPPAANFNGRTRLVRLH